jgi:hypothetical protein
VEETLVEQAVLAELATLPAGRQHSSLAMVALALARVLDGEPSGSAAAAAAKELVATLAKLGLITMSPVREVSPNSHSKLDTGDELDKIRKRRNEAST